MDIQFAYNLERMLYYISQENTHYVSTIMEQVEKQYRFEEGNHRVQLESTILKEIQTIFQSYSVSDEQTLTTIQQFYTKYQFILCPHSATAVYGALGPFVSSSATESSLSLVVAAAAATARPMVAVLTAHPDKFASTIETALGFIPTPSIRVLSLYNQPHRYQWLRKESINWRQEWIETIRSAIIAANCK
jgi:threonine synthase